MQPKTIFFLQCRQIEQLRRCEIIKESEVKALCAKAREILVEVSPNLGDKFVFCRGLLQK
jgi:hypothetical protein